MSYAILRTAKLKTMGNIGGSLAHNYRTRETLNADPQRLHQNEHSLESADLVMAAIQERLPLKRRSDAVLCIEYLISASPEYFEGNDHTGEQYFSTAIDWLKQRHGVENVISTTVHHDETSPHLVAYVVPLDEKGKLNAKSFLGGKAKLSAMQSDFAKAVEHHGLKRGIQGSQAKHQSIRDYYSKVNSSQIDAPMITPNELERAKTKADGVLGALGLVHIQERPQDVAERLNKKIEALKVQALDAREAKASEQAIRRTLHQQEETLEPILKAIRPLNVSERKELIEAVQTISNELQERRKKEFIAKIEQQAQAKKQRRLASKNKGVSR